MAQKRKALPALVGEVRSRIEHWRKTRTRRTSPMPEDLWREAAELACAHGVYRISRELGVSYESLKRRIEDLGEFTQSSQPGTASFVEVSMAELVVREERRAVVDLSSGDGARMVIELSGYEVDLQGLTESFFQRLP